MSAADSIEVPGARLRYRCTGTPGRLPLLVFENGWGASHEYWAWIEQALAPHARLLFYDRAGIGGSTAHGPQTVPALSAQLLALLAGLGIRERVVVVGHSYGGLIGGLHAVQQPAAIQAVIGLDPSPDRDDTVLDKQMAMVAPVAKLAILCARIGVPDPLFCPSGKRLPQPQGRLMVELSFGSASSLRGAVEELHLFGLIKQKLAGARTEVPHLIVSAGCASELKGWAARLFVPPERTRDLVRRMQEAHRARVALSRRGQWQELPFDHGSLVFTEAGAAASAARILAFLDRQATGAPPATR